MVAKYKADTKGIPSDPNVYPSILIDKKYRKFIEQSVHDGKQSNDVVRELWGKYGKNSACEHSIRAYYRHCRSAIESFSGKTNSNENSSKVKRKPDVVVIDEEHSISKITR